MLAKANRIWTKFMGFDQTIDYTDGNWHTTFGGVIWTPQEDVVIVGFSMHTEFCSFQEVDGMVFAYAELTQVGGNLLVRDGSLGWTQAFEEWDSMLAEQENRIYFPGKLDIMFPSGNGVNLPEGDTLYLHSHVLNLPDENHYVACGFKAHIYYLRG